MTINNSHTENKRSNEIARLNQFCISAMNDSSITKQMILQSYRNIAINAMRLKNENRRYVAAKKRVSRNENAKTRHNRAKRTKRSALLIFLESKISEACYTRKQLIELALYHFETQYAKSTISTYIADSQNEKYFVNVFNRKVKKSDNNVLHFIDSACQAKTQAELNQAEIDSMSI